MEKGTIIYMGNYELPDKNAAAHRVMNNGKIFTALGYRMVFLGTVKGESFSGIRQSSYNENIYEEAYPLGLKQWVSHIFDTRNIEAVAAKYSDTCLIITYNVPFATFKAVKKAFAKRQIKVAYDCTEWNDYAEGSLPKRLYKKYDEKLIRTKLHHICDDIIVISSLMERQYQGKNLLKLPPLVDLEESIWHQERITHTDIFEFCFAGTINNKERLDEVVKAFCELDRQDVRLRIIGLTKGGYAVAYPEQAQLVQSDNRLLFMGYVSHEESVKYVLSCDCYIFIREKTRRNEAGFPTKFAESYTCGVPIISTDVSDIKRYAIDDRLLIIENTSDKAVNEAMLHMLQIYASNDHKKELNESFDCHHYLGETEEWISRIR